VSIWFTKKRWIIGSNFTDVRCNDSLYYIILQGFLSGVILAVVAYQIRKLSDFTVDVSPAFVQDIVLEVNDQI